MEGNPSGLESYALGTVVWAKLPHFQWWPSEVIDKVATEERVTELQIKTYGDDEGEDMNTITLPKMIKIYDCPERHNYIKKGRKKYKKSYLEKFNVAINIANEKLGIEEVTETTEQSSEQCSGNFVIKRKNLATTSSSVSDNCEDSTPLLNTEYSCTSPPDSGSPKKKSDNFNTELLLTPTRKETRRRSIKQSAKRPRNDSSKGRKKMKEGGSSEDNNMINNTNDNQVTPCNSSDNESEDDLPAVSISQTPTKGYSSLRDVQSKELVWVKHSKDPFWPALAMRDGNAKKVVVNFFAYDGPEYAVKNKKKILPYFCDHKGKFEEAATYNPALKEACSEALWLLRSGNKECGSTATEQYEAIKKRRSLSQVTPCKRMTFTDDGTDSSSDEEPMESAFGYDITSNLAKNSNGGIIDEESPKSEVKSQFPKGSKYSYEILKENFLLLEPELYRIFKGEIDSENNRIFFQGTSKERNQIQIQNRCGPLIHLHTDHYHELQDTMVSWVKEWSSKEKKEVHIHEVKYVLDVLFPEATVRTIMKIEHIGKEEAWEKFKCSIYDSTD